MDPREGVLAVLSSAFREGVPELEGRVDVLRIEPIWGNEELPIAFIDFGSEQIEAQAAAPRYMKHVLPVDIVLYCKGDDAESRVSLLRMIQNIEALMREWQFVLARDVDPNHPDPDSYLVEEIRPGNSIDYFSSNNGDMPHRAARLAYEAEFYVSAASDGMARDGAPARNRLAEFRNMLVEWRLSRNPGGLTVTDHYEIGEEHES